MNERSGLALVREFLQAMVDGSRVSAARRYVAADSTITINGTEYTYEEYLDRLETSDRQFEILDVEYEVAVDDGTVIGVRHELLFEHRGAAFGVEPDHEHFRESSASFYEVDDGEITSLDITYDPTATLEELGLLSADPTTEKLRDQYYEVLNRVLRHNLRNKLNVILASAQTFREDPETAATTIEETAAELLATVEKAQKIEQMAIDAPLHPTTFDVIDAVADVLDQYQRRYDVECYCDCQEPIPDIRSDKRLLQNIIEETLQNTILYNESDTPKVTITVRPATADAFAIELGIEDNGSGIPESELEPLRQDQETQLLHGSGIGLWIIKWCVTRLDGTIEFRAGDSSLVHIALPNLGS